MSRGYGRLLGRSSSLPFHNMEWIMAWVWEDFGKPSHTKREFNKQVQNYEMFL